MMACTDRSHFLVVYQTLIKTEPTRCLPLTSLTLPYLIVLFQASGVYEERKPFAVGGLCRLSHSDRSNSTANFWFVSLAIAQGGPTSAIAGVVQDESGAVIANTKASVQSEATGEVLEHVTTRMTAVKSQVTGICGVPIPVGQVDEQVLWLPFSESERECRIAGA